MYNTYVILYVNIMKTFAYLFFCYVFTMLFSLPEWLVQSLTSRHRYNANSSWRKIHVEIFSTWFYLGMLACFITTAKCQYSLSQNLYHIHPHGHPHRLTEGILMHWSSTQALIPTLLWTAVCPWLGYLIPTG